MRNAPGSTMVTWIPNCATSCASDSEKPSTANFAEQYLSLIHICTVSQQIPDNRADVALRYRYNPDVQSLPAMVPAVIPLLLMLIPAMLTALGVVREKELGSITNFYVTPVTRLEFLLGKQLPYVALGMINFFLLVMLAVFVLSLIHI